MGSHLSKSQRELLDSPFFHLIDGLLVRQMPTEEIPYAFFDGGIPTPSQRAAILRNGLGLRINGVPIDQYSLDFLAPYEGLTHLDIVGIDFDPSRLTLLDSLVDLRLIRVNGQIPADLAGLNNLAIFTGTLVGNESVFDAPAIRKICLEDTNGKALPSLPNQLMELDIVAARKVNRLVARSASPQLRRFSLYSSASFDIDSLLAFPKLEKVYLDRVREIRHAKAFSQLSLELLALTNCGKVDDPLALADSSSRHVVITGKLGGIIRPLKRRPATVWDFANR